MAMELSPTIVLAWQIAAYEAAQAKHQYIEIEHIFIGLCKVREVLRPEVMEKMNLEGDIEELEIEIDILDGLFRDFGLEPTALRRKLRGMLKQGEYEHTEKVIHRSPKCKEFFKKAEEIAASYSAGKCCSLHLLLAILEEPGDLLSQAISEYGVEIGDIKEGITKRLKEGLPPRPKHKGKIKEKTAPQKIYFIDKYGRDMTQLAKKKKIGPIIETQKIKEELLQIIRTLTRKTKNNPLLIGEAGVGKTAIVEGLALRIASRNLTPSLQDKRIIELNMANLVAGTKYRGEFEERLTNIIQEASSHPEIILFIDEIHTVISAGAAEGALDAANILKPALARGEIRIIGATTMSEYRKYIEKDSALERRFQPIIIKEPTPEATIQILEGMKKKYEEHHQVRISFTAIKSAVELSSKYLPDRHLPDKALDVLDEACSKAKVKWLSFYGKKGEVPEQTEVDDEIVAQVVSEWTKIPVAKLTEKEEAKLINMEEILEEKVIGQKEAISAVSKSIKMAYAGLSASNRPIGVFLFLGPSGVGKTHLAKSLAEFLFGSKDEMIRLDMSEYMEKHSVAKLIGAPPGYVGYEEEGQLTAKLRQKPYSIVLLDEIEKAHPEVFDLFLQVFDEGRLTDAKGRTIDAKNAIFIMTSNIGTEIYKKHHPGFKDYDEESKIIREEIFKEVKKSFRLEFLNRIDEIIIFRPLKKDSLEKIAFGLLDELKRRLKDKEIVFDVKEEALKLIIQEGYDPINGARLLKRAIDSLITKPLSEKLLSNEFVTGDGVLVKTIDGRITFEKFKPQETEYGDTE